MRKQNEARQEWEWLGLVHGDVVRLFFSRYSHIILVYCSVEQNPLPPIVTLGTRQDAQRDWQHRQVPMVVFTVTYRVAKSVLRGGRNVEKNDKSTCT